MLDVRLAVCSFDRALTTNKCHHEQNDTLAYTNKANDMQLSDRSNGQNIDV